MKKFRWWSICNKHVKAGYVDPTERKMNTMVCYISDGRFALNLIVQDDVLNDGVKRSKGKHTDSGSGPVVFGKSTGKPAGRTYGDEGSFSRFYDLDLGGNHKYINCPKVFKRLFLL